MSDSESRPVIRPLGTDILVRQVAGTDKLASGLFIPQGHRMGFEDRAEVIAIGSKVATDVRVGDTVIFKRQPASAIVPDAREGDPLGAKDLLLLDEDNVLAVVEPD